MLVFFFSSRRRHTIWPRDWSSVVCSSDLLAHRGRQTVLTSFTPNRRGISGLTAVLITVYGPFGLVKMKRKVHGEIGRASCRERGEMPAGSGSRNKTYMLLAGRGGRAPDRQ